MSTHTQQKEALENAANAVLSYDGAFVGKISFTQKTKWLANENAPGSVTGTNYETSFVPSAQLKAWKAAWDAAQAPVAPPVDPPVDPPVQPDPSPAFVASADGLKVSIRDLSTLNGGQESWDFGDGNASVITGDQAHVYDQAGTYTIVLTIAGPTGGTWTAQQTIAVAAPPVDPPVTPPADGSEPNIGAIQPGDVWTPPAN